MYQAGSYWSFQSSQLDKIHDYVSSPETYIVPFSTTKVGDEASSIEPAGSLPILGLKNSVFPAIVSYYQFLEDDQNNDSSLYLTSLANNSIRGHLLMTVEFLLVICGV